MFCIVSGYTASSNVTSQSHSSTTNSAVSQSYPTGTTSALTTTSTPQKKMEEHSQLDEILNELLGDKMFQNIPSPTSTLDKSLANRSVSPNYGSITTHSGNSRTVVSWQTSQSGPTKSMTVTKETVAEPSVNTKVETFTKRTEELSYGKPSMVNGSVTRDERDSFSTLGSVHDRTLDSSFSRTESLNRDHVRSPANQDPMISPSSLGRVGSPPVASPIPPPRKYTHVPYRVDYENQEAMYSEEPGYNEPVHMSSYRGYASDSEEPMSWLERQQIKLRAKREGRTWRNRTEQERQLVTELRTAQTSLARRRAQSEVEENPILDQYSQPDFSTPNGPSFDSYSQDERYGRKPVSPDFRRKAMTPDPIRRSYSVSDSQKSEKSYWVSGLERPPFTTHQTKYTFSISPPKHSVTNTEAYLGNVTAKPPPSPAPGRSSAPGSPTIPQRGTSSREAVKSRTTTRDYQSQGRPLYRHRSDVSFERFRSLPKLSALDGANIESSILIIPRAPSATSLSPYPYPSRPIRPSIDQSFLLTHSNASSETGTVKGYMKAPVIGRDDPSPTSSVVEEPLVKSTVPNREPGNRTNRPTTLDK